MSRRIVFELCAETVDACLVAREAGADRIELCSALSEDGLTPSHALIRAAVEQSDVPVFVMLRPRGGDFHYSGSEFELMREDLIHARNLGAAGFVLGILNTDRTVDIARTRELVSLATPLEVTFHRAFDRTPSLDDALEDVIAAGCRRVLTSGGQPDVTAGAQSLSRLVQQSADRIAIAAGGGLRLSNAAQVAATSYAKHFHASVRRPEANGQMTVRADDIRALVTALNANA